MRTATQSFGSKASLLRGSVRRPARLKAAACVASLGTACGAVWYVCFVFGVSRLH